MRSSLITALSICALRGLLQIASARASVAEAPVANAIEPGVTTAQIWLDDTAVTTKQHVPIPKQGEGGLKKRGMAASQARLMALVARKQDLELSLAFIAQARTALAKTASGVVSAPPSAQRDAALAALLAQDRALEAEVRRLNTQLAGVQAEIEAARRALQNGS